MINPSRLQELLAQSQPPPVGKPRNPSLPPILPQPTVVGPQEALERSQWEASLPQAPFVAQPLERSQWAARDTGMPGPTLGPVGPTLGPVGPTQRLMQEYEDAQRRRQVEFLPEQRRQGDAAPIQGPTQRLGPMQQQAGALDRDRQAFEARAGALARQPVMERQAFALGQPPPATTNFGRPELGPVRPLVGPMGPIQQPWEAPFIEEQQRNLLAAAPRQGPAQIGASFGQMLQPGQQQALQAQAQANFLAQQQQQQMQQNLLGQPQMPMQPQMQQNLLGQPQMPMQPQPQMPTQPQPQMPMQPQPQPQMPMQQNLLGQGMQQFPMQPLSGSSMSGGASSGGGVFDGFKGFKGFGSGAGGVMGNLTSLGDVAGKGESDLSSALYG
jgi:hypothetical protein